MRILSSALISAASVMAGCVIINPGDVQVSGSPSPAIVASPRQQQRTAYGPALERVLGQQEKVLDELQQRDWKDVLEEASDWTQQTRILSSYADSTHDPVRFRACCDQLLAQMQTIREAALRQDAVRCLAAVRGCDSVLNALSRDFPTRSAPRPITSPPTGGRFAAPVQSDPARPRVAGAGPGAANHVYVP